MAPSRAPSTTTFVRCSVSRECNASTALSMIEFHENSQESQAIHIRD